MLSVSPLNDYAGELPAFYLNFKGWSTWLPAILFASGTTTTNLSSLFAGFDGSGCSCLQKIKAFVRLFGEVNSKT